MFKLFRSKKKAASKGELPRAHRSLIEPLEARTLLSSAVSTVLHPDIQFLASSGTTVNTTVDGYTPAEISHAYGFDRISFSNGSVKGTGKGQTIALIDAYNDPNISSDLGVFDSQFGLNAPPSLKIVNQTGGSKLPATDSGWAGEISLDVEWAHAIAPDANILLVETNSDDVTNLMAGVDYARHAAGVSVISMSWGGSEFFSWGGSESASQTNYDPTFTTPSGHQGVTFVSAAGDSGAYAGVQWPASSPNVVSVGGTSLYTTDSAGTYQTEVAWSGTSGGFSQVENEPSYQANVQNSGVRTTPDVSLNGDPNTGFAVYDSLPDQGYAGWDVVGGTSAGAPQWAALIAIADQGRALAGGTSLDGASQTLPILYGTYSDPGTTGYSSYASTFNDIVQSAGGRYHWRWGGYGYSGNQALPGYDTATGLGTPEAAQVVDALLTGTGGSTSSTGNGSSTGSTGGTGTGTGTGSGTGSGTGVSSGNGSSTPVAQQLPAGPIAGTLLSAPPTSVVGGNSGTVKLKLINTQASKFSGPVTIELVASTDSTASADDATITTDSIADLTLKPGGSKVVTLRFKYPSDLSEGSYYIVASITADNTGTAAYNAPTQMPITIGPAFVDLAAAAASQSILVTPGKNDSATLTIQNLGNVTAIGTLTVNLYASSDQTLDSSDTFLATTPGTKIRIKPGRSITLHLRFVAPLGQTGGNYFLIGSLNSVTNPADANSANDTIVLETRSA